MAPGRTGGIQMRRNIIRSSVGVSACSIALFGSEHFNRSHAVAFTEPAVFEQAPGAPLAGTLTFQTDVPTRVRVHVDDGISPWTRNFFEYSTSHQTPLYGFKPYRAYQITVTAIDRFQNEVTGEPMPYYTSTLPTGFPTINVLTAHPERMEPGYTLFRCVNSNQVIGYVMIIDNNGEVVWYSTMNAGHDIRQLEDGNLLNPLFTGFNEVNLLGETVQSWPAPNGYGIDPHEGFPTDHGTILYISEASATVANFPTSATDSSAPTETAAVDYDRIVEISMADGALVNQWNLLEMLDPRRISYLSFVKNTYGWDNHHGNAIVEDPRDHSIIVSLRSQNAVVKFSRDGALKWIVGPHENWGLDFQKYLLTPVGEPFEWNYAQHAMKVTPQGTLLLYDDGDFRASPFNDKVPDSANYSRAVEYQIDEDTMEIRQVWEYGQHTPEVFYTSFAGDTEWLPKTSHVLVNFASVSYINHVPPDPDVPKASMARIQEVTHDTDAEVLFDISIFDYNSSNANYLGYWVYRARRLPDLYGHPAVAVTDLNVTVDEESGMAVLHFSGDPVRSYTIKVSNDLNSWSTVGEAELDSDGVAKFSDAFVHDGGSQFYQIVTH